MTRLQNHRQAVADLERAVRNDPESADFRIELALARVSLALSLTRPTSLAAAEADLVRGTDRRANEEQRKLFEAAESDMTQVLGRADAPVRCYFHRSRVRLLRGDKAGADADLKAGFDHEPDDDDDLSWVTRGFQRMQQNQFEQALADFRRAEAINPRNFHALQNQAHILSERLQRPRESLDVLNRLLELYPEWPQALGGRAVLLARAGRVPEALDDVKRLLQVDPSPFAYYQAAGVYALTADQPGHLREALRLLAKALSRGEGYAYIGNDPDLDPIREQPEFRTLLNAVRTLQTLQK
jgi:tetratricopeptide (TPR) repeat protein